MERVCTSYAKTPQRKRLVEGSRGFERVQGKRVYSEGGGDGKGAKVTTTPSMVAEAEAVAEKDVAVQRGKGHTLVKEEGSRGREKEEDLGRWGEDG